jgi:regulator of sigma E protease
LDLNSVTVDALSRGEFFERVGFQPYRPAVDPVIGRVVADGPADRAGIMAGDRILAANGQAIDNWMSWVENVRANPGAVMDVRLERADQIINVALTPETISIDGKASGRIGAEVDVAGIAPIPTGIERYGVWDAIPRAIARTGDVVVTTLKFLRKMVIGEASVENLSGPISIAQYAGQSAKMGLSRFLDFLGLVSISLGILNLLPIPLLDGGHLLYYLLEFVTRRPVPDAVQIFGQQLGFVLLLGLMGLAVYNDIMRMM